MAYREIGDMESAVDAFRVYLGVNPVLRPVLEAGAERGAFPSNLAARLCTWLQRSGGRPAWLGVSRAPTRERKTRRPDV